MMNTDPLTQLRDIHVPTSMNWSWLWLGIIILMIFLLVISCIIYYRRKTLFRRQALQRLNKVEKQFQQDQNTQRLVIACNQLLRRLCLTLYPMEQVAALTGENWIEFLNQHSKKNNNLFTPNERKLLTNEIYQLETPKVDVQKFIQHIRHWIQEK